MDAESQASSSTEPESVTTHGTDSDAVTTPGVDPDAADVGRRRFFRQFAGELIHGAAGVVGAAQALQRASAEAASAILDPSSVAGAGAVPAPPTGFRAAFRESPGTLHIVDQRHLPDRLVEFDARSAAEVSYAIKEMIIRGAPATGQAAAIGLALTGAKNREARPYARRATLRGAANVLRNARPTAVSVRWAVDRVMSAAEMVGDLSEDGAAIAEAMRAEADAIVYEATEDHGRMAAAGLAALAFPDDRPLQILTHGNTGPLAGGQYGTALGVIQAAHHAGRAVHVWVDETRPNLHGARLTAWELAQAGVSHTLIADVAAGHLMAGGEVDVVLVGADRIAANGDTAHEVGTYTLAVLAARHGIPFYVVAPLNTVDLATEDGTTIPLEDRSSAEILGFRGVQIAPPDTQVRNPAFDVTPADLITGFVNEEGVIAAPFTEVLAAASFTEALAAAVERREQRRVAAPGFADLAASTMGSGS
jgi:methylthioribose-1-phosphate isomerase